MKRTKIALALSMCVLCLGMLAFAVYSAVTSATFNLNGTINFNPEGVYVDIEGKVLRGSSRTNLVELTGENFMATFGKKLLTVHLLLTYQLKMCQTLIKTLFCLNILIIATTGVRLQRK